MKPMCRFAARRPFYGEALDLFSKTSALPRVGHRASQDVQQVVFPEPLADQPREFSFLEDQATSLRAVMDCPHG